MLGVVGAELGAGWSSSLTVSADVHSNLSVPRADSAYEGLLLADLLAKC